MKIDCNLYNEHADLGVFRHRAFVTFRTIDDIVSLKTRWAKTGKGDQEILTAIAGASTESPGQVINRHCPGLTSDAITKRGQRVFERFKKGLLDCRQEGFHIVYEAMFPNNY